MFCSRNCQAEWTKRQHLNMVCPVCGKRFHLKPYHINRYNKHEHCCSRECLAKYRSEVYDGESNPNYGNRGSKNPLWKSDAKVSVYGYMLRRMPDHPFANCDGFVFEHRLIADQNLLTPESTIMIDGKPYLSPAYVVHHKDHNRLNNCVDNLEIMTHADHTKLHAQEHSKKLAS